MKSEFKVLNERIKPVVIPENFRSFDQYRDLLRFYRRTIKVLVVTDTSVNITENGGFGVGRFVKLLSETSVGCSKFAVDIAVRPFVSDVGDIAFEENPNPSPAAPHRYWDFRFDSQIDGGYVLDNYHEVFLFGFAPDNSNGPDSNISDHPWYSTDEELEVLHQWMNQGGGVFATGDHDYLGASMCSRIPRVGTMRKWTNADDVPPIGGPDRIDTNRPATPSQENGTDIIPNGVESDALPQIIEWVPEQSIQYGLIKKKRPHPILCHPTHGPINVMPDHPHEGCCVEPDDIDYSAAVKFGSDPEYPTHGSVQPKPKIIAYGNVLGFQNHAKGPVNPLHFPMISVYDGREKNDSKVGRVVVDSTWHHWFNLNLDGLEASPDQTNWEKISRYFINVAVWIAPENVYRHYCWWELIDLHFEYPGIREINPDTPVLEVGKIAREFLYKKYGACWVYQFIIINICKLNPNICRFYERFHDPIREIDPIGPVCLTCPPFETVEALILGHVHKSLEGIAGKIRYSLSTKKSGSKLEIGVEELEEVGLKGVSNGLEDLQTMLKEGIDTVSEVFLKAPRKSTSKGGKRKNMK